jgi:hypothetical protein
LRVRFPLLQPREASVYAGLRTAWVFDQASSKNVFIMTQRIKIVLDNPSRFGIVFADRRRNANDEPTKLKMKKFTFIIKDHILKTEKRTTVPSNSSDEARKSVIRILSVTTQNWSKYRSHISIKLDAPDNAFQLI